MQEERTPYPHNSLFGRMEHMLARWLLIVVAVGVGFVCLWLLKCMLGGRVSVNLFNAINAALFMALAFNIYVALRGGSFGETAPFTAAAIAAVLLFRFWKRREHTKGRGAAP